MRFRRHTCVYLAAGVAGSGRHAQQLRLRMADRCAPVNVCSCCAARLLLLMASSRVQQDGCRDDKQGRAPTHCAFVCCQLLELQAGPYKAVLLVQQSQGPCRIRGQRGCRLMSTLRSAPLDGCERIASLYLMNGVVEQHETCMLAVAPYREWPCQLPVGKGKSSAAVQGEICLDVIGRCTLQGTTG